MQVTKALVEFCFLQGRCKTGEKVEIDRLFKRETIPKDKYIENNIFVA